MLRFMVAWRGVAWGASCLCLIGMARDGQGRGGGFGFLLVMGDG